MPLNSMHCCSGAPVNRFHNQTFTCLARIHRYSLTNCAYPVASRNQTPGLLARRRNGISVVTDIAEQRKHDDEFDPSIEGLATLLVRAMDDTGSTWGCVLTRACLTTRHALVVIDRSADFPELISPDNTAPVAVDPLLFAAFDRAQPLFANRVSHDSIAGLPADCPPIRAFAMLPCRCIDRLAAVLVLVNPTVPYASDLINRIQSRMFVDKNAPGSQKTVDVEGDFSIHFQPQWHLANGQLFGFEVLPRWHGHTDAASTLACLKELEACGRLGEASDRLINLACKHWSEWNQEGLVPEGVSLAINVAAQELRLPDFVPCVTGALARYGISADQLILEIDESVWRSTDATHTLDTLKKHGVRLAVDGFGSGHSGLAVLARLPIDQIKLSPAMLRELDRTSDSAATGVAVVSCLIELARSLVLPIVAVGVESVSTRDTLAELGCSAAQGYGMAPPLPAGQIPALLAQLESSSGISPGTFLNLADERPLEDKPSAGTLLFAPA